MSYDPLRNIILRTEVGSTAYGAGLPGHEDLDHMAVCVETRAQCYGLEAFGHLIHRPGRSPQEPSGPGDLDLTIFSVRKWARLALKGNPSVLMLLFGIPVETTVIGARLHTLHESFVSKHTARAFLGYARQQRERMTGERGRAGRVRRNPGTPGDVDWKYAMHMLRLGYQGYEYLTTGHIECPIEPQKRELLTAVRRGEHKLQDVIEESMKNEQHLYEIMSTLPNDPESVRVQNTVMGIYEDWWGRVATDRHMYDWVIIQFDTNHETEPMRSVLLVIGDWVKAAERAETLMDDDVKARVWELMQVEPGNNLCFWSTEHPGRYVIVHRYG